MLGFIKKLFKKKEELPPVMQQNDEFHVSHVWNNSLQSMVPVEEPSDAEMIEKVVDEEIPEPEVTAPAKRKKRTPAKKTPAKKTPAKKTAPKKVK